MAFDRNDPADLLALKTEVNTDPDGLGYIPDSTFEGVLDIINLKRAAYIVSKPAIAPALVRAATTYDAYNNLSIDEQEWVRWMTPNSGDFQVTDDMKLQLTGRSRASGGVVGTGNDSNSFWAAAHRNEMAPVFLALIEVPGSRAEVLWDEGSMVSVANIGHAANL